MRLETEPSFGQLDAVEAYAYLIRALETPEVLAGFQEFLESSSDWRDPSGLLALLKTASFSKVFQDGWRAERSCQRYSTPENSEMFFKSVINRTLSQFPYECIGLLPPKEIGSLIRQASWVKNFAKKEARWLIFLIDQFIDRAFPRVSLREPEELFKGLDDLSSLAWERVFGSLNSNGQFVPRLKEFSLEDLLSGLMLEVDDGVELGKITTVDLQQIAPLGLLADGSTVVGRTFYQGGYLSLSSRADSVAEAIITTGLQVKGPGFTGQETPLLPQAGGEQRLSEKPRPFRQGSLSFDGKVQNSLAIPMVSRLKIHIGKTRCADGATLAESETGTSWFFSPAQLTLLAGLQVLPPPLLEKADQGFVVVEKGIDGRVTIKTLALAGGFFQDLGSTTPLDSVEEDVWYLLDQRRESFRRRLGGLKVEIPAVFINRSFLDESYYRNPFLKE